MYHIMKEEVGKYVKWIDWSVFFQNLLVMPGQELDVRSYWFEDGDDTSQEVVKKKMEEERERKHGWLESFHTALPFLNEG